MPDDQGTPPAAAPPPGNRPPGRRRPALSFAPLRARFPADAARVVWLTVLPVGVSLLSLVLSVYSLVLTRAAPDVALTMPDRVRVAQGPDAAYLYLQPRFVNTGNNQRTEVIRTLAVAIAPADASTATPLPFSWDEQGTWTYDDVSKELTWQFVADPAPLVVGPTDPQFPTCLFIAPVGWTWLPGAYRVTITAPRTLRDEPLHGDVTFTLTPSQVAAVTNAPGLFLEIPTTP